MFQEIFGQDAGCRVPRRVLRARKFVICRLRSPPIISRYRSVSGRRRPRENDAMHPIPCLAALATAVPAYALDQEAVVERVKRLFAGTEEITRLLPVFANSGIVRRYASVPIDWFAEPHSWPERNRLYLATAVDLLESAAGRVLDRAGVAAEAIGAIVVVST